MIAVLAVLAACQTQSGGTGERFPFPGGVARSGDQQSGALADAFDVPAGPDGILSGPDNGSTVAAGGELAGRGAGGMAELVALRKRSIASDQILLRLDPGMHVAAIRGADATPDGRFIATAGLDKTVRVWSEDGRLLTTLRPPINAFLEGQLHAVALAPDGRTAALAGWTGPAWARDKMVVYLFDATANRMIRVLQGLPDVVFSLAFSPDGRHLIAGLGGGNGYRIWQTGSWQPVGDAKPVDGNVFNIAFAPDGGAALSSDAGELVVLDSASLSERLRRRIEGKPHGLAFHPRLPELAIGFVDSTRVAIVSRDTLVPLRMLEETDIVGDLSVVAWSRDGRFLFGAGSFIKGTGQGNQRVRRWTFNGATAQRSDLAVGAATGRVSALRSLPGGGLVVATTDPTLAVLDTQGNPRFVKATPHFDFRNRDASFALNADGSMVRFAVEGPRGDDARQMVFDFRKRLLRLASSVSESFTEPVVAGLPISNWRDGDRPLLNGQPLELEPNERSRSVAIAPDRQHFALGTEWFVRYYDGSGRLLWDAPTPGIVWRVQVTPDNSAIVAALGDGSIRYYDTRDGRERLALYLQRQKLEWVLWTPEGFFDHSPGGEALVGYSVNAAPDQSAEFIRVDRFYNTYFRPDLVRRRLPGADDRSLAAVTQVVPPAAERLRTQGLPPVVALENGGVTGSSATLRLTVAPRTGGLGRVILRQNGVATVLHDVAGVGSGGDGLITTTQQILLREGPNRITLSAFDRYGEIESDIAALEMPGPAAAVPAARRLFIFTAGISEYPQEIEGISPLKYSAHTAQLFQERLSSAAEGGYQGIFNDVIVNAEVTRGNLKSRMKKFLETATINDVVVIALSGHGYFDERTGKYYYITYPERGTSSQNTRRISVNDALSRSFSHDDLIDILGNVKALDAVVFLDTCYSGTAFNGSDATGGVAYVNEAGQGKLSYASGRSFVSSAGATQAFEIDDPQYAASIFGFSMVKSLDQIAPKVTPTTPADIGKIKDMVFQIVDAVKKKLIGSNALRPEAKEAIQEQNPTSRISKPFILLSKVSAGQLY